MKYEIYIIISSLVLIRFPGAVVDGMSLNKSSWIKWHSFNFIRRDFIIGAIYFYLWQTSKNNEFLIIPLLYAISLNWSIHVIGYVIGDELSNYSKGLKVSGLSLIVSIGSALCFMAGLFFSVMQIQNFHTVFGIGLLVGFIWAVAYRIAYNNYEFPGTIR